MNLADDLAVVLFDGECGLCNGCVRWFLARDRRHRYRIASLQSQAAQPLLRKFGVAQGSLDSVIVIDRNQMLQKSDAVLHLLSEMRWGYRCLRIFSLVPRVLRDAVYDYVGSNRYHWWGRAKQCVLDDMSWRSRILDIDPQLNQSHSDNKQTGNTA